MEPNNETRGAGEAQARAIAEAAELSRRVRRFWNEWRQENDADIDRMTAYEMTMQFTESFACSAIAAERERCARLLDEEAKSYETKSGESSKAGDAGPRTTE